MEVKKDKNGDYWLPGRRFCLHPIDYVEDEKGNGLVDPETGKRIAIYCGKQLYFRWIKTDEDGNGYKEWEPVCSDHFMRREGGVSSTKDMYKKSV